MAWTEIGKKIIVVLIGALLNALAMNFFLLPANVFASGFAGASQLISTITETFTSYSISTGLLVLLLNIPVTILAWYKVGKSFTIYSFMAVISMSLFMEILPIYAFSDDIMLNAVFGGVIGAAGIGLTFKFGASTGGMDIVAMILSKMNDKPVGIYFFTLNGVIIITAGMVFDWEKSLYTLIALYVSTRVIDAIHTRYQKVTAMIVTSKAVQLKEAIHSKLVRGITMIPAKGAYTNSQKDMLIIVITRYELYDLRQIIQEVDSEAFTNIMQTNEVMGFFRKD